MEGDGSRRAGVVDDPLVIAGTEFDSRLIVGTGKYPDNATMVEAVRASGAAMITVAVRRVDLDRSNEEGILHHLNPDDFFLLPNTAGCSTADEAIRYARLARAAGFDDWLKLEVIGDQETLLPDVEETLKATRTLVEEGFKVMAYTNDDVVTALKLEDAGVVSVMPLASPIGSGMGVVNPYFIREIKRRVEVPVIVDAGVGTASDAAITMEQGVDGVLMNTAIASGGHGGGHEAGGSGRASRLPGRSHAQSGDRRPVVSHPGDAGLLIDRAYPSMDAVIPSHAPPA